MAETTLVPLIGASVAVVALAVLAFAAYSRNRPALVEGPHLVGVSFLGILGGLAVVLVAEAAASAHSLLYVGGVACLVGVAVLTGAIASMSPPEGDETETAH